VAAWAEGLFEEALVRAPVAPDRREAFLAFLSGAPPEPPPSRPDDGGAEEDAAADQAADPVVAPPQADPAGAAAPLEAPAPAQAAPPAGAPAEPPEGPPAQEVTPEELAADLAGRLWQLNQDLSLAVDAWDELPGEARRMIVEQARYMAELYPYLTGAPR
jgi:hypothetical protein